MTYREALIAVQDALTPHGSVYWPTDLIIGDDGRLAPPGAPGPWWILWPLDALPHENWEWFAFDTAVIQLSCGGQVVGQALEAVNIVRQNLPSRSFRVTDQASPSYSREAGNRVVVIPVNLSAPVAAH